MRKTQMQFERRQPQHCRTATAGSLPDAGFRLSSEKQGRQDSNLQPPVLETGALPVELRPSARRHCIGVQRRPLGALFVLLAAGFAVVAVFAALAGGGAWIVAVPAAALSAWMGESPYRMFR